MKFTYILGNPPYQEETDVNGRQPPIYDKFLDAAYTVGEKVMLIHPGRFLFNAGQTPKAWNKKMLDDPHLKVIAYYPDSKDVFPNADIMGGVVITYHDETKEYGAIEVFSPYPELNDIMHKVESHGIKSIAEIFISFMYFNLDALYADYPDYVSLIGTNGRDRILRTNIFSRIPLFTDEPYDDDISILGLQSNKRVWKHFPIKYLSTDNCKNIYKYKVLVPKSNGSGAIGVVVPTNVIGDPVLAKPLEGFTQSFISIGSFDTEYEAEACLKYIKSKFARCMLGILKITQDNPPSMWKYVPLQDFTDSSDIDWSVSIPEIDQQLYRKYNLTPEETEFIETHVKPME